MNSPTVVPSGGDRPPRDPALASSLPGPLGVSVILPVFNGARSVARAVASITSQRPAPQELLLIDDGSTDGSAALLEEIARSSPSARVVRNPVNTGLASTLNQGLRAAEGAIVLILHQDCSLVGEDWLLRAVRHFDDPSVISVVGAALHRVEEMDPLEREFWVLRGHAMESQEGGPGRYTRFSENKCDLFRRDALLELGGFDTRLEEGGEDQVLAWKLRQTRSRVVHDAGLRFSILLVSGGGLHTHLRKDAAYGRQMRQVLGATHFGALRRSSGAPVDPRFVNRASGVLWILLALLGAVGLLWSRNPWWLVLVVLPPLLRWLQLTARAVRERRAYRLGRRELLSIGAIGWLADLAYGIGFLLPTRHPPGRVVARAGQ